MLIEQGLVDCPLLLIFETTVEVAGFYRFGRRHLGHTTSVKTLNQGFRLQAFSARPGSMASDSISNLMGCMLIRGTHCSRQSARLN